MLNLNKKEQNKNYLFFKSQIISLKLFFVDLKIDIPLSISNYLSNNILFLRKDLNFFVIKKKKILFLIKNNKILIKIN
jgi:hypothetical protein